MKIKLTNMLRRKERNNRYAKLNRGRWGRFIYIKDLLQEGKNSRKSKQRNKCRKNNYRFKKLEVKKKKRKKKEKESSMELQMPNIKAEVYNNNKKCEWGRGKGSKA